MQATARMASVVSSTLPARRRLIRDVRPTNSAMPDSDKKPSRLVNPLEDVVATVVAIGVLGAITYLILLWLR